LPFLSIILILRRPSTILRLSPAARDAPGDAQWVSEWGRQAAEGGRATLAARSHAARPAQQHKAAASCELRRGQRCPRRPPSPLTVVHVRGTVRKVGWVHKAGVHLRYSKLPGGHGSANRPPARPACLRASHPLPCRQPQAPARQQQPGHQPTAAAADVAAAAAHRPSDRPQAHLDNFHGCLLGLQDTGVSQNLLVVLLVLNHRYKDGGRVACTGRARGGGGAGGQGGGIKQLGRLPAAATAAAWPP
jgi:hypothetical protein